MKKRAIIIGAGPAGLTAAYELITRTDIIPVILEKSADIGGLSKTVNYKGNRMDIGGHRFFSKSDRVMEWWTNILPIDAGAIHDVSIQYHGQSYHLDEHLLHKPVSDSSKVMLLRNRLSRIYYDGHFFDYPISLSFSTLKKLGFTKTIRIMISYGKAVLFPIKEERSLEDFFINRFGKELYQVFFKEYTEKVWGLPCNKISAEWGRQRIKKLSILKTILHAIRKNIKFLPGSSIAQKETETSLIDKFLYPTLGPGQLWEEVAAFVVANGGEIHFKQEVKSLVHSNHIVQSITAINDQQVEKIYEGDYFFSTMPVKELVQGLQPAAPATVHTVASNLQYRDFITVGLLVKKLAISEDAHYPIKDNWIYIQEPHVKIGRLQFYNNWSPAMVANSEYIWMGLEYFCNVGDELWNKTDEDFIRFAIHEMEQMRFIDKDAVVDSTIVRMEKTYPAYFGMYSRFGEVQDYVNTFNNLFLVGRNGMHKYNNADHSMLTAMIAVDNIINGVETKDNIWEVNTEEEYHEKKH